MPSLKPCIIWPRKPWNTTTPAIPMTSAETETAVRRGWRRMLRHANSRFSHAASLSSTTCVRRIMVTSLSA